MRNKLSLPPFPFPLAFDQWKNSVTDEEESYRRLRDPVHVTLITCCVFITNNPRYWKSIQVVEGENDIFVPKNGEWVDATTERFIYQVSLIEKRRLESDHDKDGQKFASCSSCAAGE